MTRRQRNGSSISFLNPSAIFNCSLSIAFACGFSLFATAADTATVRTNRDQPGSIEHQVVSKFSRIRVRKNGTVRTLAFVRDSGQEALESQIDLRAPYELKFEYLKSMFLSYAVVPKPKRVLIVGLGGGAMVHFFKKYDPEVHVDVVEIDPEIVRIAEKYFGITSGSEGASPNVIVDDGLALIGRTKNQYDVIYLDAFLKPSAKTDSTGVPLAQRTQQFYQSIQDALVPDGIAVFNINPHERMRQDVVGIGEAFPQAYAFSLANNSGKVVVGSKVATRTPRSLLAKNLEQADERLQPHYSLRARLSSLDH